MTDILEEPIQNSQILTHEMVGLHEENALKRFTMLFSVNHL